MAELWGKLVGPPQKGYIREESPLNSPKTPTLKTKDNCKGQSSIMNNGFRKSARQKIASTYCSQSIEILKYLKLLTRSLIMAENFNIAMKWGMAGSIFPGGEIVVESLS